MQVEDLHQGKIPQLAAVPESPVRPNKKELLQKVAGIQPEEAYSKDERALNDFLRLHPMLRQANLPSNPGVTAGPLPLVTSDPSPVTVSFPPSLEATSQRTLELVSGMFERAVMSADNVVCIPKSYDDQFLSPAFQNIGERSCVNEKRCLAQFIAQIRYGSETEMAFTCKEFLLPAQRERFLAGNGLPHRRGKCLLCSRYFINYCYILARTDSSFKIGESSIQPQSFCNPVTNLPPSKSEEESNVRDAMRIPTHACSVNAKDGYKPSATLFVDEDWAKLRSCREGQMSKLLFRPTVRFCSTHYKYVKDAEGVRIVQVGIGVDDQNDSPSFFGRPSVPEVAAPAAAK